MLDLGRLQVRGLLVAAGPLQRLQHLTCVAALVERELDERRFELMVIRPAAVEQIGL